MQVAGTEYAFLPYAQPVITPAITWGVDSAGYWHGSDRGASEDVYEADVSYALTESVMDGLQTKFQVYREGVSLSSFSSSGQEIFGPGVNYSGSINATVVNPGIVNHIHFNRIATTTIRYRALSPTLLGTTPLFWPLRLDEGWEGGQDWQVVKGFTHNQTAVYADHLSSLGRMTGSFSVPVGYAPGFIAYLLTTVRANTIVLPTFSGVSYPFGINRGSGPFNVKIPEWNVKRKNLKRWIFNVTFVEDL